MSLIYYVEMKRLKYEQNSEKRTSWYYFISDSKVIKLFSCSTQLSTKFQLFIKLKYRQMKKFLALSLSYVVFIMLINVKMPTIVGILTFMSRINFVLNWVEHEKCFVTSGPDLRLIKGTGRMFLKIKDSLMNNTTIYQYEHPPTKPEGNKTFFKFTNDRYISITCTNLRSL